MGEEKARAKKQKESEEAEMRDRLIELGDIYFIIAKFIPSDEFAPYIAEVKITEKNRNKYIARRTDNDCVWYSIKKSDLGKTVFLTKEEAEKALAERSGNER